MSPSPRFFFSSGDKSCCRDNHCLITGDANGKGSCNVPTLYFPLPCRIASGDEGKVETGGSFRHCNKTRVWDKRRSLLLVAVDVEAAVEIEVKTEVNVDLFSCLTSS